MGHACLACRRLNAVYPMNGETVKLHDDEVIPERTSRVVEAFSERSSNDEQITGDHFKGEARRALIVRRIKEFEHGAVTL